MKNLDSGRPSASPGTPHAKDQGAERALMADRTTRATNAVCERYVEPDDYCGCARCGHSKGDHRPQMSAQEEPRMKASDIPTDEFVGFVAALSDAKKADGRNAAGWVMTWDLQEHWPDVPPKVLLAKARGLIKRGILDGCGCGCRGDFTVNPCGAHEASTSDRTAS